MSEPRAIQLLSSAYPDGRRSLSLLDLKQAIAASAPWSPTAVHPDAPAERVLAGAKRLAPALGARMIATTVLDRSVFVRELLPQDLKVELDRISVEDGRAVARYLGLVVGRAHARQLDPDSRRRWLSEMQTHRTKNIDAPSWLWHAVVDLVSGQNQFMFAAPRTDPWSSASWALAKALMRDVEWMACRDSPEVALRHVKDLVKDQLEQAEAAAEEVLARRG